MKLCFWTLIFLLVSGHGRAEELKVPFATGEWPPYTSVTLPGYGPASVLVTAICKAGGLEPVYIFHPWKRSEKVVAVGEVFAAFPYAKTKDRIEIYDFSEPVYSTVTVFMYLAETPDGGPPVHHRRLEDLKGYRIGGILGGFYRPILEKAGLHYETTRTLEQSIRKLERGRIDLCIGGQLALYEAVNKTFPYRKDQFKVLSKPLSPKTPAHLLVSRTYPNAGAILKRFHQGLERIKRTGEYDRILNMYRMVR